MMEREAILAEIEKAGCIMRQSGRCDSWFDGCDEHVKKVSETVNGPMIGDFAVAIGHSNNNLADMFRHGGQFFGHLPAGGIGEAVTSAGPVGDVEALRANCHASNCQLADTMRADSFEEAVHELTCADASRGWMSYPVPASQCDLTCVRAVPRFGIEQGVKKDGSIKVRAVDNFSWIAPDADVPQQTRRQCKLASLNGCTSVPERIQHDHLDDLLGSVHHAKSLFGELPSIFKADIASAFRRVPLAPEQTWAAAIMYIFQGVVMFSRHWASPFGALSSVYNWERVGRFFCTLARKLLHIAVFEYVDDYFAAERAETVEHAMLCFARLVRAMLGPDAIAPGKLEFGRSLSVLGVSVILLPDRFQLRPCKGKMMKCLAVMRAALAPGGSLPGGGAQKLAGRLQWACQYLFHRLGRAMIRPIYAQAKFGRSSVGEELRFALLWWCRVIELDIVEERFWEVSEAPVAHMFVDASGIESRCAAVLFIDGKCLYTDGVPRQQIMDQFLARRDRQITTLEILAISIGLSTFASELRSRKVVVWSDNTGAEAASRKGSAKAWDHCRLVHDIWEQALQNNSHIWVERVPSHDNISDSPSRCAYDLMRRLNASWRKPVVASMYLSCGPSPREST